MMPDVGFWCCTGVAETGLLLKHATTVGVGESIAKKRILFFKKPPESNEDEGPNRGTSIT